MFHFFELVFLSIVACTSAGMQSFDGGNYVVKWMHLPETKEIEFNITVKATGWVGLGISKENVDMKKLDVVVGGFNNGTQYLWDMYVDAKTRPTEDMQKDAKFVSGSESNGVTNLCFKRKLNTGDASKDNELEVNVPYYLAWAFHSSNDATDPLTFSFHTNKGYSGSTMILVPSAPTNSSSVPPTVPTTTAVASLFAPAVLLMATAAAAVHVLSYV